MTETNMNTSNPYDGERRAGTVGFPLPDVELKVTDPKTGQTLADGEIGIIEVRGPNVFQGYWQMPDKTAAELREEFSAADLQRIISTLTTLSQQTNNINSEQGVLQLASDILSAIENDPALRQELMGNINPQAQQQKRHLTIQEVEEGTKPMPSSHQEPQAIANVYGKMMRNVVELLQEKEDEEEKKEE